MLFSALKIPFHKTAKTKGFRPLTADTARTTAVADIQPHGVHRPKTAHSGKIRLGGGCRLPLQGDPMERDRAPRSGQRETE